MTTSDISLKSWGLSPKTQLLIDGHDVSSSVQALSLWIEPVTHAKHLDVRLIPAPVDLELRDVAVLVDADTHDFLVRLGWTPPAEDKEAMG